jgi:peroxiredoxin
MIAVGDRAPDFTLLDQDGEKVSLSEFRGGKLLLVFYPQDFSPVCADQLSIYQEVKPEIEAEGVRMVGISIDHAFAHKAFQETLGIDTPLLCDFEPKGEVARAYGAYIEDRGHANRSLVLIDEGGHRRVGPRIADSARDPWRQLNLRRARL